MLDKIFERYYIKFQINGSSVGEAPAKQTGHCPEASKEVLRTG
jgi:hypothetical protein